MRSMESVSTHQAGGLPAGLQAYPDEKLRALNAWHDDLDLAIGALVETGCYDDLAIVRLKKRKLQIKDAIASAATPALPALADELPDEAAILDAEGIPDADLLPAAPRSSSFATVLLTTFAFLTGLGLVLQVVADAASEFYTKMLLLAILTGG